VNLRAATALCSVLLLLIAHTQAVASSWELEGVERSTGMGANARRIILDNQVLPASSFYLPNSFVSNGEHRFYGFLHGISRVRRKTSRAGCEPDCSDAMAYAEVDLWKKANQSFSLQYSLHSLSGRNGGTAVGEGQSMGFKYARTLSSTSAFSFSGEHILQLDDTVDLGRNYFLGYSKFSAGNLFGTLPGIGYVFNVGLGTGLYSLYGNDLISTSSVLTSPYFSNDKRVFSEDDNKLNWGVVGSVAYYFNSKVALGAEYSGFGFGVGMSLKPFRNLPLTTTGYLYDVIDNFPHGIPCAEDPCQPRLYGRATYSF